MTMSIDELATVQAALRYWQRDLLTGDLALHDYEEFFEAAEPLTGIGIDGLCEKLEALQSILLLGGADALMVYDALEALSPTEPEAWEWRNRLLIQLEGVTADDDDGADRYGRCRICGCVDERACAGGCAWADDTHTLCDNPECLKAAVAATAEVVPLFQRVAEAAANAVRYEGRRSDSGCSVLVREEGKPTRALPLYLAECNHSPTGFEWGYQGSGPAQLAFALVYHATRDAERARAVHQEFKVREIAPIGREKGGTWSMTRGRVLECVAQIEQERSGMVAVL